MKIDSIIPLIGLLDPNVNFENGEDRILKLFKRTMWATLALRTLDWVGYCLFPNPTHRFFNYLYIASRISSELLIPAIFLTITEAARVKFNYNKAISSN